jgi:hypothetical protein
MTPQKRLNVILRNCHSCLQRKYRNLSTPHFSAVHFLTPAQLFLVVRESPRLRVTQHAGK